MQLPFFYSEQIGETGSVLTLNEETSKHVVSVLRMKEREEIHLTDGKGTLLTATITEAHKKHCNVNIANAVFSNKPAPAITVAISLLKNSSRFEWFLEKVTEIGINKIVPLLCERTERQHFRKDRMEGVLISAMLQSRQCWMPELSEPVKASLYMQQDQSNTTLYIAHCDDQQKTALNEQKSSEAESCICIGPEGDFSKNEIELALRIGFIPVSLGNTRLRTETAGIVAATVLKNQ